MTVQQPSSSGVVVTWLMDDDGVSHAKERGKRLSLCGERASGLRPPSADEVPCLRCRGLTTLRRPADQSGDTAS